MQRDEVLCSTRTGSSESAFPNLLPSSQRPGRTNDRFKMVNIIDVVQLWPQLFASIMVTLLVIDINLAMGWTSPYLAQLTSDDSPFPVTDEEASWIASLLPLGRVLGGIIGFFALEYIGSKTSVLLTGLPMIFSWICIICANSTIWLYFSRILSGISMGMVVSSAPLYIGEISAPSIRGALVCLVLTGFPIGTLFGNVMGSYMPMMYFGTISLIISLCYMGIFSFFPQSPYYYVRRNNTERAERAIQWYYQKSYVGSEMETIEHFVKSTHAMSMRKRLKQIKEPQNRRSFIILSFMFLQLSVLSIIIFYMEIIVRKAMVTSIAPSTLVIIISALYIFVSCMGIFAIDRYGRKILLTISSFAVMISMILLGVHFFLLDYDYNPNNFEWLVILSLVLYTLMCFGLTLIPSTMLSELFPSDLRSVAGFVASIMSAVFTFVISKTYQPLVDLISEKYVFWIYAVIMVISFVYSLTMMPETKGKTLQEIQDMMTARNAKRSQQVVHAETEETQT